MQISRREYYETRSNRLVDLYLSGLPILVSVTYYTSLILVVYSDHEERVLQDVVKNYQSCLESYRYRTRYITSRVSTMASKSEARGA